jgi:hypothetical protein
MSSMGRDTTCRPVEPIAESGCEEYLYVFKPALRRPARGGAPTPPCSPAPAGLFSSPYYRVSQMVTGRIESALRRLDLHPG